VLILTLKKEHRGDTISTEHVSWILFGKIKGCFYLFLCDGKMWKNAQKKRTRDTYRRRLNLLSKFSRDILENSIQ